MGTNKKIACPECGQPIELVTVQDQPHRLIAYHDCLTGIRRGVYLTDDPDYISLDDRLEPGEPAGRTMTRSK